MRPFGIEPEPRDRIIRMTRLCHTTAIADNLRAVTKQLFVYGILGVITSAAAFTVNHRLFDRAKVGSVTVLEGACYAIGITSLVLGWYFNVRYVHQYGGHATYLNYTKTLFNSWASDSAAQDYVIVNVLLLPLWSIVDGRRRGMRAPWMFVVMSLFTSLAFSVAMYLAFVERQNRHNRAALAASNTA